MAVWQWDRTTELNNAIADSNINWAEGQAPSSVNNSARMMMREIARYRDDTAGLTTTGTATAYLVTTRQVFTSIPLMDNASLVIVPHVSSGVAPTLTVDGLVPAKPIRFATGTAPATGALVQRTPYQITFSNANSEWLVQNIPAVIATGALAVDTVGAAQIVASGVGTSELADDSVTTAKIFASSVTNVKLADANIARAKLKPEPSDAGKAIGYAPTTGNVVAITVSDFLLHAREQQTAGVNSTSASVANTYSTRVLNNTVTNEIAGGSVASNQITLPAGTYWATGWVMARVGATGSAYQLKARLRNITAGSTTLVGSSELITNTGTGSPDMNARSLINGRFTLAGATVLEVQLGTGVNGAGLATAAGNIAAAGEAEVYTDIMIWKTA